MIELKLRAPRSRIPPGTCSIRCLFYIESFFSTRAIEPRVRGSRIYVSYWTLCERSERADNKLDNLACWLDLDRQPVTKYFARMAGPVAPRTTAPQLAYLLVSLLSQQDCLSLAAHCTRTLHMHTAPALKEVFCPNL